MQLQPTQLLCRFVRTRKLAWTDMLAHAACMCVHRSHYPRPVSITLWIMAEVAIIGSDIQVRYSHSVISLTCMSSPVQHQVACTPACVFISDMPRMLACVCVCVCVYTGGYRQCSCPIYPQSGSPTYVGLCSHISLCVIRTATDRESR